MACSHCGSSKSYQQPKTQPVLHTARPVPQTVGKADKFDPSIVVPKSDTTELVKIRYYGGGASHRKSGVGCKACGGGGAGAYSTTTEETIEFVSDDSPRSLFKQTFQIGHDYYVTKNQAEMYLLKLTFVNKAGQVQHKFKKV